MRLLDLVPCTRAALVLALALVGCGPAPLDPPDAGERPSGDGGAVEEPLDAGQDPPEAVCTSGTRWTRGNTGSARMQPGNACITCHVSSARAPRFRVAGTVYPTLHEELRCNGHDGTRDDTVVEVTSATGTRRVLPVNEAGNFFLETALTFPLKVKVVRDGRERAMQAEVNNGDCNACHTVYGANGAPGRIRIPDPE